MSKENVELEENVEDNINPEDSKGLIYITKGLRINCKDSRNIVPQESYMKQDNTIGWKDHGYHRSPESAISRIIDLALLPGKEVTLNQYIEFFKNFRVRLLKEVVHYANLRG